jgi:hypothetical protein
MIAEIIYPPYNEGTMKPKLFFRSHKKKIVAGAPIIFLLLLGSSGILSGGNTLTLTTDSIFVSVNDEVPVTLLLSTKTPINAAGGTVTFSPDIVTVDSLTRTSSLIDLWSEEPVTSNEAGTVRFSGGIIGPHVSATGNRGTVFILNMRAQKEGKAVLRVKDGELLANDGSGANQISSTGSLTLYIRASGKPSPDINGDGELSLSDVNVLYIKTFRAYDARYDINSDGKVDWSDVRSLIALL